MIAIGKLVKTVGLKGEIKLYPYSPEPSCYEGCQLFIGDKVYILEQFRMHKGMGFMTLQGLNRIEDVEELINLEVFMDRSDIELDEDEYLIADLIGLVVQTPDGEVLGTVKDVLTSAGADILVVQGESEILIPMVDEFIQTIDMDQQLITASLIEGMR